MTSTKVVSYVKKTLNCKKAGHTGTLDPLAAGVLPICVGKGTKIASYILEQDKTYICEATLGKQTDTDDLEGKIIHSVDSVNVSMHDLESILADFQGEIMQIPPIYSAIRQGGKRLYELARKGERVEPKPRSVKIYSIELIDFLSPDRFLFKVRCSKGTYIRSLCRDIGQVLGYGAHMSFLLRTETGSFNIDDAITLQELEYYQRQDRVGDVLVSIDDALEDIDYAVVNKAQYRRIINGGFIGIEDIDYISESSESKNKSEFIKIYCDRQLIGTGFFEIRSDEKMLRVKRLLI